MSSKKYKKKLGGEELQRIIDLCRSVEERGLDPFLVDVDDIIEIVRSYFPEWESMEELSLDLEAICQVASIIRLQNKWIKHRSSFFYIDPVLIKEKLWRLSIEELATLFLRAWFPIVEMEQISPYILSRGIQYWQTLTPINKNLKNRELIKIKLGITSKEELIEQGVITEKTFSEALEILWEELRQKVGENGKIAYWDFVGADTYDETVKRAYMTSFLATYRYATFEVNRIEEEIFIKPLIKPSSLPNNWQMISVPISINIEEWKKWQKNKHN